MKHEAEGHSATGAMTGGHYRRLLVMTAISFIAMYFLMYAMVARIANVYLSFNQFYMAGLMTAAMVFIELLVMSGMYPDRKLNAILIVVSLISLCAFWFAIRQQTAIGDRQFVKSMIPHHSGALLMCQQASLTDPDLVRLCESILRGQQSEIDQMTAILQKTKH